MPVTLVTGWHGSGAASVAAGLAKAAGVARTGLITGDDDAQTAEIAPALAWRVVTEEDVIEQVEGCTGCSQRIDLWRILLHASRGSFPPARVLVQVGGWSDVVIAAQTINRDPDLRRCAALDRVVVAVDGPSAAARAAGGPAWPSQEAAEQVAVADHVILTSVAATTADGLARVREAIRRTNPFAPIQRLEDDLSTVLLGRPYGRESTTQLVRMACPHQPVEPGRPAGSTSENERSDPGSAPTPGSANPVPVARVPENPTLAADPCSVTVTVPGDLDACRVRDWVRTLHHANDGRLLRIRGVVAVAGHDRRVVCRGVGTFVEFDTGDPWGEEARSTTLVVAGRGLPAGDLHRSLAACA
ncbi:MAG: GTP-binding protein [Acidimicrobiales bacterium]